MRAILLTLILTLLAGSPASGGILLAQDSSGEQSQRRIDSRRGNRTAEMVQETGFGGLWSTNFGRMRLNVDGEKVTGTYSYGHGSKIEGEIDREGKLQFVYTEPETSGEGWFELAEDGQSFAGQWRAKGARSWRGWRGQRVQPKAKMTWLIVLEAHWENGLNESEYAFGDMLRSYFTMAPDKVAVRHRFFHDADDLRRFCREVAFLAEPVVLLISTHGTKKGISVGGRTVTPKEFAPTLAHAHNIKLLHLSGCDMMSGDVPNQIHDLLKDGPQFPISGYKETVAWDASALADYTFLSMLLLRNQAPMAAADHAIRVSPYLGEKVPAGSAFRPLGLTVVPPASVAATQSPAPSDPRIDAVDAKDAP